MYLFSDSNTPTIRICYGIVKLIRWDIKKSEKQQHYCLSLLILLCDCNNVGQGIAALTATLTFMFMRL